ncbi:phospholipase C [Asaia krungthepensis]|uniref:Acid phosphatase n=1 Tax=Asaia krungthepensis NRIC 0535 TaxID=1307925 RepID=A0ABQ0Q6V5_9PROT|nr:alkaline phosphatase family protein [Asaia krungthepensis]GBQ93985.1 acid phosphatase [Asaia krungthepensis NRIC 0535]
MISPIRSLAAALLTLTCLSPAAVTRAAPEPVKTLSASDLRTKTPIKHVLVIFDENVSFDHYFATYPQAANPEGEPVFLPKLGTPPANTLLRSNLLVTNPNTNPANGADASVPFRLDRTQASTADQNHGYTAEQMAYNGGKADLFPLHTGRGSPGGVGAFATRGQVMGYFDGNTVTALWRYAQRFAMSDNAYTDTYGPSTPGALEIVSGQTNGLHITASSQKPSTRQIVSPFIGDGQGGMTMINDIDPTGDVCSIPGEQVWMEGRNIGDLLNAKGVSWGGFMAGFDLSTHNRNGTTGCQRATYSTVVAQTVVDYIPHHNWFQYYPSTSNPKHLRPSGVEAIGQTLGVDGKTKDPANHQYDLEDFMAATRSGHMPAVSFLKLPAFQDAHAGYSNPLDEQEGVVRLVNFVQSRPEWKDTAIIIAYDDSDGWYDHAFTPVQHSSHDASADQLDGAGQCGKAPASVGLRGKPVNGRCGPGTRTPLLVLSPWARQNAIDHTLLTQSSVLRFIENNWLDGMRLGGGSFDQDARDMDGLFDFTRTPDTTPLYLAPKDGAVLREAPNAF